MLFIFEKICVAKVDLGADNRLLKVATIFPKSGHSLRQLLRKDMCKTNFFKFVVCWTQFSKTLAHTVAILIGKHVKITFGRAFPIKVWVLRVMLSKMAHLFTLRLFADD